MSDIVWSNVLMLSILSAGVLTPISYFSLKLFKSFDYRVVKFLSNRNAFLAKSLESLSHKMRQADMSLSKLQLENSKLSSERRELVRKVDDAVKRVDFIDDFFSQFFSSLDFEVIMALVDAYPDKISTKDLAKSVGVSHKKSYSSANRLFKQGWLVKNRTKSFPVTNLWSLKKNKFDLLSTIIE